MMEASVVRWSNAVPLQPSTWLDRLIEMTDTTSGAITYAYDAENRRFQKTTNAGTPSPSTREYVYDGWRVIEEDATADGTAEQRYIWANGSDRLLAVERLESGIWKRYFVHNDALGSTRVLTDANGTVVATFRFGAFGETLEATGSQSGCTVVTCLMPFRYTGQQFDPEGGLYYYKNRTYHPWAGRFLTRDPAGYVDGVNLYAYVRNAPSIWTDPLGLRAAASSPHLNAIDVHSFRDGWTLDSTTEGDAEASEKAIAAHNKKQQAEEKQTSPSPAQANTTGGNASGDGKKSRTSTAGKPKQPNPRKPGSQTQAPQKSPSEAASQAQGGRVVNDQIDDNAKAAKLIKELMNPKNAAGLASVEEFVEKSKNGTRQASEVAAYLVRMDGSVQLYDITSSGNPLHSDFSHLSKVAEQCKCDVYALVHSHPKHPDIPTTPRPVSTEDRKLNLEAMGATSAFIIRPDGTYYYTKSGSVSSDYLVPGGPQL